MLNDIIPRRWAKLRKQKPIRESGISSMHASFPNRFLIVHNLFLILLDAVHIKKLYVIYIYIYIYIVFNKITKTN